MAPPGAQSEVWRFNFWEAALSVEPELWGNLQKEVYPVYRPAYEALVSSEYRESVRGDYTLHGTVAVGDAPPILRALSAALAGWQAHWGLSPEWCELRLLNQMYLWTRIPDWEGAEPVYYPFGGEVPRLTPPTLPAWDPWSPWKAYEVRVLAQLAAYKQASEGVLKAQGWTAQTYGRGESPATHLRWLAMAVLKGMKVSEIIEAEGWALSRRDKASTITKGIRGASERVGLTVPGGIYD